MPYRQNLFTGQPDFYQGLAQLGIGPILRNQGWSLISSVSANLSQASMSTPSSMYTGANNGVTSVLNEVSPVSVPAVKLVYGNWFGNAQPNGFMQAYNDIYVKGSVVNRTTFQTGQALFNDDKQVTIRSRQIATSDPIRFPITANTPYDVRSYFSVSSPTNSLPRTLIIGAGSGGDDNPNGTDGATKYDNTHGAAGTNNHAAGNINVCAHTAILGYTGTSPTKTLALLGDSIMAGTGDVGIPYQGTGGWGVRIALGVSGVSVSAPLTTTAYGYVLCARGADTVSHFVTTLNANQGQLALASLATNVISDFGINDISTGGSSLATLQANTLTLATLVAGQGQKFITSTVLPQTSSTDGWSTVTNQTDIAGAVRTQYNSWLRDTSASGFVSQAAAASGYSTYWFGTFDAAAAVEVNGSNVLTPNGLYWAAPTASPVFSGTVTTGTSSYQFTDTSLSVTTNQYRGYTLRWKTGANAGKNCVVRTMVSGTKQVQTTGSTNTITVGDTYDIILGIGTVDGTHPTSWAHNAVAITFPTSLLV